MEDVGQPDLFGKLECGAGKLREALGVVGKVALVIGVETVAVEVKGIIEEKITNTAMKTAADGGKTQAGALRYGHAGKNHGRGLHVPVTREKDGNFMAELDQRARERLDHIGKATSFRIWQGFGRYEKDAHGQDEISTLSDTGPGVNTEDRARCLEQCGCHARQHRRAAF